LQLAVAGGVDGQTLLQLAVAGGVDGQTPLQLLHQAEELLTGPYALPTVADLQQQHENRVEAELAAAAAEGAAEAGAAGGEGVYTGFEVFTAADGKFAVKWRRMQQLLAKVLWQQLQLQPDGTTAEERQQLTERYMEAAAAAGSADSMAAGCDDFVAVNAYMCDDVVPHLASAVEGLPKDAAAWQAVTGSKGTPVPVQAETVSGDAYTVRQTPVQSGMRFQS
jgi:3-oxoacyl-ACP reductase-like protein